MPSPKPFLPRIYSLPAAFASDPTGHEKWLAHAAGLGFDHILLCGQAGSIPAWLKACGRYKLKLLLDFDVARQLADPMLTQERPGWFDEQEAEEEVLPDPRRLPTQTTVAERRLRDDAGVLEAVAAHLRTSLAQWRQAGVAGVRCLGLGQLPGTVWQGLTTAEESGDAQRNGFRFLAWTPGITPEQLAALSAARFDASFSSAAWWDYRARWLSEEYARLLALAPPIGFPESPDESVVARVPGHDDPALRAGISRRALRLAASIGNGLLVPLGFEFGLAGQAAELADPDVARARADFNLCDDLRQANALAAQAGQYCGALQQLGSGEGGASVLLRTCAAGQGDQGLLIVINPDPAIERSASERQLLEHAQGLVRAERVLPPGVTDASLPASHGELRLAPADVQVFAARRPPAILVPSARTKTALAAAMRQPRIAIEAVSPCIDGVRFEVKRNVGDIVDIEADVFMDGHDKLAVALLWRAADEAEWQEVRMHPLGNDRWRASLPLTRLGRHLFAVEAWYDRFETYRYELEKKSDAGLNVALELEEGRLLVEKAAAYAQERALPQAQELKALAQSLAVPGRDKTKATERDAERIAALLSEPTAEAMRAADARPFAVRSESLRIDAERRAARFSSWYELFPRSQSGDPQRHGTFEDVVKRLPAIAAMGFDTLYFPPIHPIGKKNRKGRNNSLTP
ncbi:MAG TPA: maltotransferase domain-containing protein, partial [Noviherbaspirillum sp.]